MEIKINLNINDRIVNFVKKMFSGKRLIISVTVLTLTTGILLYAAPVVLKTFHSGDVISAADVNANFEALRDKIAAVEANSNGAPVGTIMAFAGTSGKLPAGWLLCDGSAYNRTNASYVALFEAISDNWGSGDGTTTFNVPDLRGVFLRGSNNIGANNRIDTYADPEFTNRVFLYNDGNQRLGNETELIGSFQMDAFQGHVHIAALQQATTGGTTTFGQGSGSQTYGYTSFPSTDGTNGTPRTTSESRSKNAAVHYIIKY